MNLRVLIIVALVVLVPASMVFAQEIQVNPPQFPVDPGTIPGVSQEGQAAQDGGGSGGVQPLTDAQNADSLEQLIVDLYAASVRIVGLAAFLMLLYAGVRRLMGNVQESNRIITDAIVGTVLLLSSVVILNSINPDTVIQKGRVLDPNRFDPPGTRGGAILPIIVQ